jgi:hypothetical protein
MRGIVPGFCFDSHRCRDFEESLMLLAGDSPIQAGRNKVWSFPAVADQIGQYAPGGGKITAVDEPKIITGSYPSNRAGQPEALPVGHEADS